MAPGFRNEIDSCYANDPMKPLHRFASAGAIDGDVGWLDRMTRAEA